MVLGSTPADRSQEGSTPADGRSLPWSQWPAVCESHILGRVCRRQT
ncbi:unnamed protein product [Staurois parvus]|uniref:Uncharacterized protein n=1 Tax=Staurois parvus TaxID=386267 RepID=A0ABN9APF1_9NEOB|nr:unnamed protein product [Staurois parvus]